MVNGAKRYAFTLNNWTDEHKDGLEALFDSGQAQYICWGEETGDGGTPHLQGFIYFSRKYTIRQIANSGTLFNAHCECINGSIAANVRYCNKAGKDDNNRPFGTNPTFVEFGERPAEAGARTDLSTLHEVIKEGHNIKQIADEHWGMFVRYHRSINAGIRLYSTPRTWVPDVQVYWGPTGTGKTRKAFEGTDLSQIYVHPGGRWFDGFMGQPRAIFDDYGGSEFKLTYFLKLLDRYPMRVPIKGEFVNWNPKEIIITSNMPPHHWYAGAKQQHVDAMFRRFTQVTHFNEPIMPSSST